MSTAQIKAAFINALGDGGNCHLCTMNYIDEGRTQLVRFYAHLHGKAGEQVVEIRVPRGSSMIEAAKAKAMEIRDGR